MRRLDEETASRRRRSAVSARNENTRTIISHLPQEDQTRQSAPNAEQANSGSSSPSFSDTFLRLTQVRDALSYLEESMVGDSSDTNGEQSTRQTTTSNAESSIGPSHSAIVLSEESNLASADSEAVLSQDLPEYMRATTNMMQNMARTRRGDSQTNNTGRLTSSSNMSSNASRQPGSSGISPRNRASDAASSRSVRPVRESSSGPIRPEGRSTITLPAWRVSHRNDDSASTILGRRVASRAAAARSPAPDQRRLPPLWHENAGASGVFIPPRPDNVARLTAQFDAASRLTGRPDDSDGSETEVDNYIFRPIRVARGRDSVLRQRRAASNRPSTNLPDAAPISPSTSTGPSSSESTTQIADEDQSPDVSSYLHNVYGHLDRITNALSDARSSISRIPSSTDGEDLDGALFSRRTEGRQEGDSLYHEVVDEEEGRSYRIRRRVNADGDEQVHQLNADPWWDWENYPEVIPPNSLEVLREGDTYRRILPATQPATNADSSNVSLLERLRRTFDSWSQSQQSETDLPPLITDTPSTSTNMPTRRRRGWARLDANGDEIPTDEEEEIDRILTAQRTRGTWQNPWRIATSAPTVRTRLEYLAPTTRSVFSHATDEDDEDENEVRVRLSLPPTLPRRRLSNPRYNAFSDAWKEKEKGREPEREFFGTSEPYYVSPIPRLLEEHAFSSSGNSSGNNSALSGFAELQPKQVAGL